MKDGIPSEFLTAAQRGDPSAQYAVGWYYENAKGVRKSFSEAEKWWTRAAEAGNLSAQYGLGNIAYSQRNLVQAEQWWRKAAEKGDRRAQHCLGFFCSEIIGADEALKWTKKAANNGDAEAQKFLGFLTFWGGAVDRDRVAGMKWLIVGTERSASPVSRLYYKFTRWWMQRLMSRDEVVQAKRLAQQWLEDRSGKTVPTNGSE
jgi:TPR repeat protein